VLLGDGRQLLDGLADGEQAGLLHCVVCRVEMRARPALTHYPEDASDIASVATLCVLLRCLKRNRLQPCALIERASLLVALDRYARKTR
jgi:hypothetical protein